MMNRLSLTLLVIIVLMSVSLSGCTSNKGGNDESQEEGSYWVYDSFDGAMITGAGAQPAGGEHDIDITLEEGLILQIILNISYEDGDAGTNPDVIEESTITGFDDTGKEMTDSIPGGTMPFSDQFILKADEGRYLQSNFMVVETFIAYAGDDTWPGPLIWRGVPDEVYNYHIDFSIEYSGVEGEMEE